jgi:hypothetical protein
MDLDLYKSELCLTDNAPIRLLSAAVCALPALPAWSG